MQCLAVDVGNTSTALGVVSGSRVRFVQHIQGGIDDLDAAHAALEGINKRCSLKGAVLGSVVPAANRRWIKLIQQMTYCHPLVVTHTSVLGVAIDYPKPASIGADRLANASAAVARYGAPVIVADFGTALTFDVIADGPRYVGGVIAPGLPLMTDYLADRTALLPLIHPKGRCGDVGRSTEGAMRIGAQIGYRGMIREIVNHLQQGLETDAATLCATGGYAKWVLTGAGMPFVVDPHLTLRGLARIFELNMRNVTEKKDTL